MDIKVGRSPPEAVLRGRSRACAEGRTEKAGCEETEREDDHLEDIPYKLRRRNSETLRAQYIDTKELRICIGTWNVGGKLPAEDLNIEEWLDKEKPADIYVFGFQEIVPLNAGNIFGPQGSRPVSRWEHLIHETLNRIQTVKPNYKCYSDPPSPSRFKPSGDTAVTMDELLPDMDSDTDDDEQQSSFHMDSDECPSSIDDSKCTLSSSCSPSADASVPQEPDQHKSTMKRLDRCHHFTSLDYDVNSETSATQQKKLIKTLSSSERIGLIWPEQPLELLATRVLDSSNSFGSVKSFRTYNSFKSVHYKDLPEIGPIPEFNLNIIRPRKKRAPFVRIVSKQMVGIFLSIWVRRSLRKHILNLKVSTVGVGVMGYIGNKGSISVSMSIYQTLFCFVCTHLSSGEKGGNELRRNTDVQEIHRRTRFSTVATVGVPKKIHDHERIFWLGDLNYRIDLSYERTHELISKKGWSGLAEKDQLKRELKKGRAFDGWSEGVINFPPTYKYEFNSEKYIGEDQKGRRRTPAWCDRILSFGKGVKLLSYQRSELKLSDHRPVTAIFMAEVEVFCHRKLQKALILTDAEIGDGEILSDIDFEVGMGRVS
ncbi:type IV inositol polyphosphate 5-phosphatase 3 isoform X2 [Phoenix dactylifera]|uniref:Type IV inositol polyphosphate 5-phosphatase 3 isoform X2 n=1 Tax=Phoenix dactylifera TaxID=42345 RepID=A0A8B7C7U5_PHODC|nr:type IV inositol polyphosphate 5-phosphatase 3 isoform X2 [Phoenix dactylifera]